MGFSILVALTLVLIFLSFPAGIYTVFYTQLSGNFSASSAVQSTFFFIGPSAVFVPLPTSYGVVFLALAAIYLGMILLAGFQGAGFFSSFRAAFREGLGQFFSNRLVVAVIAISSLIFSVVVFDSLETSSGIPIGSLSGDAFQLFFSLTIAPLREEFGFRMIIIGLLAMVACVGLPWRTALKALWRPSAAYEGRSRDNATLGLIIAGLVISSVTFGLVHILSNSGWEIGKLPVATYAGFVFGYLYIRYGFHVAVLAHWGDDYLSSVFSFLGQGAPANSVASNTGYFLDQLLSFDLLELIGFASFLLVAYLGAKRFWDWRTARANLAAA